MLDFLMISTRSPKRGIIEIYPKFIIPYRESSDLMIRGGDFYAIWDAESGMWSTSERDAIRLIDKELDTYVNEHKDSFNDTIKVLHLWDAESGMIDAWHKYCQKQLRDSYTSLDEQLVFANTSTTKQDYASKSLSYPLEKGSCPGYEALVSTLYSPEERHKLEWAIGSIVTGKSKDIQKFIVLYGEAGTGKSTLLNIIQELFDGYCSTFDAKALGSNSNAFALEAFKSNPLVAIQHDGDLSHIEDNTRLNSLVSHELMMVNEKFKSAYASKFNAFLFMGTNRPVKITDAKSGLLRRLIDVSPTGEKLSPAAYRKSMAMIPFELGAIAWHCKEVFEEDPNYYDNYIPTSMMGASNDFYNFVEESYAVFKRDDFTVMKVAWEMYDSYNTRAKVSYPYSQRVFREELKNYFREYKERFTLPDGTRVRHYYSGFRWEKFEDQVLGETESEKVNDRIVLNGSKSTFDIQCAEWPAQYATEEGTPKRAWTNVKTKLKDLDTSKLHYVLFPEGESSHIVIDFDLKNENGEKSLERNLAEASKWPATYTELSKSGAGVHLHYIYDGDATKLSRIYDENIEIKVYTGNSALRRMLTEFNELPITHINSGLPLKGEDRVLNKKSVQSERGLRTLIKRNLAKEIHASTRQSIDFIHKILEDAYNSGLHYDVSDMRNDITTFAAQSSHQSAYCLKVVLDMKFQSDDPSENFDDDGTDIVFFDCEVFPNLLLINWKYAGEEKPVYRMINPTPSAVEKLTEKKLIGFNNRKYDNHILYARMLGWSNYEIYQLSQKLVSEERGGCFAEAYNLSYTDIYDFSSKKQSLKKFEIELGIHHQELGLPWDQPVPEEMWNEVAEYCDNDVIATEAVFYARKADFLAREILAEIAGMTVNDTTNSLSTRIIFGTERNPQSSFNYRDMGKITKGTTNATITGDRIIYQGFGDEYTLFDEENRPVFPGYKYEFGKSTYRDEEVGEGGYVYAEPGMYAFVALLDIASMHPSSIIDEWLFGEYTQRFQDILNARLAIKHGEFDSAKKMLNGALAKYLTDESSAGDLSQALKIVINSVYGLTAAKFENPFRDPRNDDNIVAKRGALFMINLKHEVQTRGFTVAHIKTDSIKIPNATSEIIKFVVDYGKMYGYNFEHEATYERMCLVNDAVYIAKFATREQCDRLYTKEYVDSYKDCCKDCKKHGGEWTATGKQFAVPYVFKTLFSNEPVVYDDLCQTFAVKTALYLDMNEDKPDVSENEALLDKYVKKQLKSGMSYSEITATDEYTNAMKAIDIGHAYSFVGKVGSFVPVVPGCGGGILYRKSVNKSTGATTWSAPSGSTGYRWLEAELVKELGMEDQIDRRFHSALIDSAIDNMRNYGDVEYFISDAPFETFPIEDESPY